MTTDVAKKLDENITHGDVRKDSRKRYGSNLNGYCPPLAPPPEITRSGMAPLQIVAPPPEVIVPLQCPLQYPLPPYATTMVLLVIWAGDSGWCCW